MTAAEARRYVLIAWFGLIGVQLANQITRAVLAKTQDYLPQPHKLLAGAVVYTLLGGLAEVAPPLSVALAVGVDLAVLLGPAVAPQGDQTLFDKLAGLLQRAA